MPPSGRVRGRVAALLVAALLAAGCGAPAAPDETGATPAAVASQTPVVPAAASSAPGSSARPMDAGPAVALEPLPQPTLTDGFAIGEALYDPTRMADAVVSLLDRMQVGIYAADGAPIRQGAEQDSDDLWLFEDEVRGLIQMGEADALAMGEGTVPTTVADLQAALAPLLPDLSVAELAAAYDSAYAEHPDELVAQVMLGQPIEPGTPLTRVQRWLLYVDGFVAPTGLARARTSIAARAPRPGEPARPLDLGRVNLPTFLSPDPSQSAQEFAMVLAHLPMLGFTVPFEIAPFQSAAHEGHGGEGAPVTLKARHRPGGSTAIVSPFTGQPLIRPAFTGLDGLMVTWESSGIGALQAHGSVDVQPSLPVATDALGVTSLTFTPKREAADGQGREAIDVAQVEASVDLQDLVLQHYAIPIQAMGFIRGRRTAFGLVMVGWHTGGLDVSLENVYRDLTIFVGTGEAHGSGTDRAEGFLAEQADGTYRGLLDASVSGSFSGAAMGESCSDQFSGDQQILAVGEPSPSGSNVVLRFYPASTPSLSTGSCTVPIPFPGGGPDLQPAGSFLPFNDTRWTTQIGFQIDVPATGLLQYSIPSPAGLQGSSTWTIRAERVEAGP